MLQIESLDIHVHLLMIQGFVPDDSASMYLPLVVSLVVTGGAPTSHHQLEPNLTDYLGKFCTDYNPCTLRG